MEFLKKFFKTESKNEKIKNEVSDFFPKDEKNGIEVIMLIFAQR